MSFETSFLTFAILEKLENLEVYKPQIRHDDDPAEDFSNYFQKSLEIIIFRLLVMNMRVKEFLSEISRQRALRAISMIFSILSIIKASEISEFKLYMTSMLLIRAGAT